MALIDHKSFKDRYDLVIRGRDDLHDYQKRAVRFLKDHPMSALFIDVGMGKSVISLTLIADMLNEGWRGKCLVVAPLRVAKSTWPTEIQEWKQAAGIDYQLIRAEDSDDEVKTEHKKWYRKFYEAERRVGESPRDATKFARRKTAPYIAKVKQKIKARQATSRAELHIINIEALEWLVKFWEMMGRTRNRHWPYDTVILDESSKFKDYTTNRFRALKKCLPRIKRLHELTASPASETYEHLFAQVFLMDQGKRLGRNITAYRQEHFNHIRKARKWVMKKGHDKKISDKIADLTLVMKAEDYREQLQVEDWIPVKRSIILPTDLQAKIKDFEKTFILKLDDQRIEALNSAAMFNKLLQTTSGAVYDDEKKVVPVHDEKIESLRELIDELQGQPLLVGYWFQSSLARLKKAFPQASVMDKNGDCIDAWNAGKIPILFMQWAGTAHGLNMQKGPGHDLATFDLCWSRELYEQLIGRLARQGQKQAVRVHHLLCMDTVDEIVYECLMDKGEGQRRLFEFLRQARARMADNDNFYDKKLLQEIRLAA